MNRLSFLLLCACSGSPQTMGDDEMTPHPASPNDAAPDAPASDAGPAMEAGIDAAVDAAVDDAASTDSGSPDTGADVMIPNGGCLTNSDCKSTEYCETGVGNCGLVGVCKTTPLICPLTYVPVCGCDGATYDNDCNAHASRTSVSFNSACK